MNARDPFMTIRSTRRAVSPAFASAWLAFAGLAGAVSALAAPAVPAAAAAAASAAASASAPAAGSDASAVTQYTVKAGQSLADVAAAATQSHDKVVLGRAAKAIFDANPSAFMRGDPSLLKLGAVLHVPPLDATGAVVKAERAPPTVSAAASSTAAGPAAPQVAASAAAASGAQTTKPASSPAAAVAQAPASAAASASAKAAAPAVIASNTVPAAPRAQPAAPGVASGAHAWAGAIQPAPVTPASAAGEGASGVAAASGATTASAPAAVAGAAASSGTAAGASFATSAASASAASRPKVSSLQQLLTLKNRVLMELQRHGFGAPSAGRSGEEGHAPGGASGFAVAPPASGAAVAPAAGQARTAAAANERFVGIGGVGFSVARKDVPAIAAVAAAVVTALLVLLVALGISGRKRRTSAQAARSAGGVTGAVSAAPNTEPVQPAATSAESADDPIETEFLAILARNPSSKRALMGLAGRYAERRNARGFDEIAQRIYRLSGGHGPNWVYITSLGRQLDPDNPLFALEAGDADEPAVTDALPTAGPSEPTPDASQAAVPPVLDESNEGGPEPAAETPPPLSPAEEAVRPTQASPEAADASLPSIETSDVEPVSAHDSAWGEASAPPEPEPERARPPLAEPMLPPEAVAALHGLDIGLPPRIDAGGERTADHAQAQPQEGEPEHDGFEEAAEPDNADEAQARTGGWPQDEPGRNFDEEPKTDPQHEEHEGHEGHEGGHPTPATRPGVAGMGAAPIGPLALSFDLDLPGADAGGHNGAPAAEAALPEFTPEQLAKIARNKLDLAAEYIALGDLGGARTLIHEVIESKDAATREEAHALLATLAPLS